eukprot:5949372-Pleurochrysis_carterae.AAC.1
MIALHGAVRCYLVLGCGRHRGMGRPPKNIHAVRIQTDRSSLFIDTKNSPRTANKSGTECVGFREVYGQNISEQ